jgi:hypothetical protein
LWNSRNSFLRPFQFNSLFNGRMKKQTKIK